jgi:uncharacterized LabA/DUF88 family protein
MSNGTQAGDSKKKRVMAFIDGFNLYHALEKFDHGIDEADQQRYRKYKWLCLTSLLGRFIASDTEELVGVQFFTAYPYWDAQKRFRHMEFVGTQEQMGVKVTLGEFKEKTVSCKATCREEFMSREEKQTDVNIAVAMLDLAEHYDKLILLTADSDQVPALKLIRKLHPAKILALLPPIGRNSKELAKVCDQHFRITEQHLVECQMPTLVPVTKNGKKVGTFFVKPSIWP